MRSKVKFVEILANHQGKSGNRLGFFQKGGRAGTIGRQLFYDRQPDKFRERASTEHRFEM